MGKKDETLAVEDDQILLPKPSGGRGGGVLGWIVAVLLAGGAGYLWFGVHQPMADEAAKKAAALVDADKRAGEARKAADDAKAELEKLQAELKQARDDLAKSSAKNAEDDKLLADLKKEVGGGAEVAGAGGQITVTLVDKILFQSGEADLSPQGEQVLRALGKVLKTNDKLIEVSGHADNQPVKSELKELYPTNWELSTARATNVVRFLNEEVGIKPRRLKAAGFGSSRPVASNASPAGRAKNRRIEILLLPDKLKVVKGGELADEVAAAHASAKDAPAPPRAKDKDRAKAVAALHAKQAAAAKPAAGAKKKK
jgi:chemotaxis protein MotB